MKETQSDICQMRFIFKFIIRNLLINNNRIIIQLRHEPAIIVKGYFRISHKRSDENRLNLVNG